MLFLYYDIFYFVLELFTTFQEFENPISISGDARDMGLILEVGRSPRLGNGTLLQYSCQESSIGRGGWQAADHGATKSCIELWLTHTNNKTYHLLPHYLSKETLGITQANLTQLNPSSLLLMLDLPSGKELKVISSMFSGGVQN